MLFYQAIRLPNSWLVMATLWGGRRLLCSGDGVRGVVAAVAVLVGTVCVDACTSMCLCVVCSCFTPCRHRVSVTLSRRGPGRRYFSLQNCQLRSLYVRWR